MLPGVPLHLPISARDAAELADIIFESADGGPLREPVRKRIVSRVAGRQYQSFRAWPGSLAQDPVHNDAYFMAVDALGSGETAGLLVRIALASAPASGVFPNAILIARTRTAQGRECVINAIPFGPAQHHEIGVYVEQVERAFLPRPLGAQPAIIVATTDPETAMPAAFEAFRRIARSSGQNVTAIVSTTEQPERFLSAALWSAIRAGWRDGYGAGWCISLANGMEAARNSAQAGRNFTKFTVTALRGADSIDACAQVYGWLLATKASHQAWKHFDFELSFVDSRISDPDDIAACLEELKRCGCAVHSIVPDLRGLGAAELDAAIAGLVDRLRVWNTGLTLREPHPRSRHAGTRLSYEITLPAGTDAESTLDGILDVAALR